jgi:hypothetical protein
VGSTRLGATLARIPGGGYPGDRPGPQEASAELDGAVIVAVIAVLVVKVPVHHVVDVIAVGHRDVTAGRAVNVSLVVPTTSMGGSATGRVGAADRESVLVHMVAVDVMKVPVMEVVEVPFMPDGRVTAAGTMLVSVAFVSRMGLHGFFS